MNRNSQLLCIWSGVLSIFIFFLGFWPLMHFFPPLSPTMNAQQIAALYLANGVGIRLGAVCILYSAATLIPFYGVITYQMKRIEGGFGPLSIAQIALAVLAVVPFIPAAVDFSVATFRPDRDINEILSLSDSGWILLFMVAPPAMFQYFAIGYAILIDKRPQPVFPRWMGFFTFWSALATLPSVVVVFFFRGPFAWNGLFGFWIPANLFGIWTFVMAWLLFKAMKQEQLEVAGH